ncbi:hypothetical protein M409DRAFT_53976 [Zasmidium cellare ATCC 36951]|uniref:F-box domain-containing protein n=1 Tax=Zasmidium cellare ATCC 36951 TaxID=1080233 RepID=A0A6A6CK07_ZASCE|nr:uncharacterized protein M409DRAFT_53976 [Zasmidium cellare ATCC 36951]KAF2167371.1 hypothetical protein M409DRAFT_53976 [Zasmidium cellare ATCC 36951]
MSNTTRHGILVPIASLETLLSHLTLRETLTLRRLSSPIKNIIDTAVPAQQKLFFTAVLPVIPPPLPTTLELNPLLFARSYKWFKKDRFQFYEHPGQFYQFHLGDQPQPGVAAGAQPLEGQGGGPHAAKPDDAHVAYPAPPPITWIARITVTNANGVKYGDLLRQAVRECRRQGARGTDSVTMEARFPYGQRLRLEKYTEVLGRLSDGQRERLGV